jgi:predicted MFS family arabinose efflux permease
MSMLFTCLLMASLPLVRHCVSFVGESTVAVCVPCLMGLVFPIFNSLPKTLVEELTTDTDAKRGQYNALLTLTMNVGQIAVCALGVVVQATNDTTYVLVAGAIVSFAALALCVTYESCHSLSGQPDQYHQLPPDIERSKSARF